MKSLIVSAFVASSLFAAPAILVTPAVAQNCGPDAPAAYLRPGGFCDNADGGKSLSEPQSGGCDSILYLQRVKFDALPKGTRVHMADTCVIDCRFDTGFRSLQPGDRLHVAASLPEGCNQQ